MILVFAQIVAESHTLAKRIPTPCYLLCHIHSTFGKSLCTRPQCIVIAHARSMH